MNLFKTFVFLLTMWIQEVKNRFIFVISAPKALFSELPNSTTSLKSHVLKVCYFMCMDVLATCSSENHLHAVSLDAGKVIIFPGTKLQTVGSQMQGLEIEPWSLKEQLKIFLTTESYFQSTKYYFSLYFYIYSQLLCPIQAFQLQFGIYILISMYVNIHNKYIVLCHYCL